MASEGQQAGSALEPGTDEIPQQLFMSKLEFHVSCDVASINQRRATKKNTAKSVSSMDSYYLAKKHANNLHPLQDQEWLAARILSFIADPYIICKLALINKNFHSASNSDLLWHNRLPPKHHLEAILRECDQFDEATIRNKGALYLRLCRSISLYRGLKKFWIDWTTGGQCFMLSARCLSIAWGSTPQNWEWFSACPGSWFKKVAYLHSVRWFDIGGRFQQWLMPGTYVVSFRIKVRYFHMWNESPIKLCVEKISSRAFPNFPHESEVLFDSSFPRSDSRPAPALDPNVPNAYQVCSANTQKKGAHQSWENTWVEHHPWIECDVGEFTVDKQESSTGPVEIQFSMREIEKLWCKNELVLDAVMIRPNCVMKSCYGESLYTYEVFMV